MDDVSSEQIQASVRIQSAVRLKLGVPIGLVNIAYLLYQYFAAHVPPTGVGVISAYIVYAVATFVVARRPGSLSWRDIAVLTAVFDPLMLSAWLYAGGESAILVQGFYLFTILGFGFRIGPSIMRICQVVSIAGFAWVLLASPFWKTHPFFGLSHLVMLLAVPMYAGALMRELRAAKARAEMESRAKNQLLANVSHELRTPLTGIVSAAQLLGVSSQSPETTRLVNSILSLSGSLDTEISQLLDLSKLGVQAGPGRPVPFDLNAITGNVRTALEETALAKGIRLVIDVDPSIPERLLGQPRDLESVLMNLTGNAVKFTNEGVVRLEIRNTGATEGTCALWFAVTDTGIGIPAEHQKRLFEPFYRVETGDRRQYRGTGLGTTIAMEHVRRMGGELQLESEPGNGSVFWFEITLPMATPETVLAAPSPNAPRLSPKRVLIADDNRVNLDLLQEMLLKDGHLVATASNGTDALEQLASASFDVVLLDFNMGDIDGLTVFQTYSFGRLKPTPTFFITADTSAPTAEKLHDAGAAGVIYKPLSFEKLRSALASLFPDEAGVIAAPAPPDRARPVRLAPVPVAHVDPDIIDQLREVKDQPAFIYAILGEGIGDLVGIRPMLEAALASKNLSEVHLRAHAMKGVALSVGAVRLAALGERLMQVTSSQLVTSGEKLRSELDSTFEGSIEALEALRAPFATSSSKLA